MYAQISKLAKLGLALTILTACQQSANKTVETNHSSSLLSASEAPAQKVRNLGITLSGPQYVMVSMTGNYILNVPAGVAVASAAWTFSDGGTASGTAPVQHQFFTSGANLLRVDVTSATGEQIVFTQNVNVVAYNELLYCVSDLSMSVPRDVSTGATNAMSVSIPPCLKQVHATVTWNFGDGTPGSALTSVTHTYAAPGDYAVTATVVVGSDGNGTNNGLTATYVLSAPITVADLAPPPPPDPNACQRGGDTRQIVGSNYTTNKTCGVNGSQTDTYHDLITQTCMAQPDESLKWQETSRVKTLVSEGECQSQACALPDGAMTGVTAIAQGLVLVNGVYYVANGAMVTFYSSQAPEGACSTVSEVRSCANGMLSGSTDHKFLLCRNGCTGFGPDGTVKTGVLTGSVTVARTCEFGETGVTDTYNQVSDQMCSNGQVTTSNARQGSLVTAGVCPSYAWASTGLYGECSAACGGTQNEGYVCKDDKGAIAPDARCKSAMPVVTRLCDANPDSVKRSEVSTAEDTGGSTQMCPANQIGVITKSRTATTTTNYACIEHSVQVASTSTTYSEWVTESYCRDFVAYRCSQDSLNNTQAGGRYDWMVKCAPQVPVIKQFLEVFDDVTAKGGFHVGDEGRVLYPTFMYTSNDCKNEKKTYSNGKGGHDVEREHASGNHDNCNKRDGRSHDEKRNCESTKVWIAPTSASASCTVPAGIYVAAVCISSCATPEQNIMVQATTEKRLKYVTFAEAWEQKIPLVATLRAGSTASSKDVQGSKVEQWVTEMMDTEHVILEFHMRSGGVLRLTPNHPLLGSDAMMHLASEFKAGDSVVKLGFTLDKIVEVKTTSYFGKVYNVFVQSNDPRQNVVVTNGYLNGSAFFQNEGAQNVNRDVLRIRLIQGALK